MAYSSDRRSYRGQYDAASSSSSLGGVLGPDGKLSSASAAASLRYAKPHELPSHPSVGVDAQSSANKAASLAANGGSPENWRYSGSFTGQSTGNQNNRQSTNNPYQGVSEEGRQKALLAATMSVNRGKAKSTPAHTPPLSSKALQATRMKRFDMPAEMFTEHPPVQPEVESKRYNDALRASSVSMAKQLQKLEQNKNAEPVNGKPNYPGLKEAAQQLAAARLAKLDPDGIQAFREHYGYGIRASDAAQADKIRGQMSQFNASLANVDDEKRQKDRDALMALAEKRVQERLKALDEKVFSETGQMLPSISADWEAEARAKAEANSTERNLTTTKVHIGGGKYIDMAEVEAVAQARMQPTLDEITETAQKRRERDEEIRLAEEERRKQLAEERAEAQRDRDEKRMKDYQQKNELRAQMAVEKAERDKVRAEDETERKRVRDEEKAKQFQEKNERKAQEAEDRAQRKQYEEEDKAERKKIQDEQRTERDKIAAEQKAIRAEEKAERDQRKAEDKIKRDRIKAEERADKERMRAEQKAEREAKREQEREDRLARIADEQEKAKEKARLLQEEEEAEARISAAFEREDAKEEQDDEDLGPTDLPKGAKTTSSSEKDEVAETSDADTQIQVGTETKEADYKGTENIVKEEMTEDGLTRSDTAHNVADRVLSAPVEEVSEADQTTMSRGIETEDGDIKPIEENVVVDSGATNLDSTDSNKLEVPATSPVPRRESRRSSFFNKLKSSIRGSNSRSAAWKSGRPTSETISTPAEESSAIAAATESTGSEAKVDSEAADTTTSSTENVDKAGERAESEGGLYSEPSDTTERPNEDRAAEGDNVSSVYATDDADYDEARARTSTSSAERFDDARDELDSESTTGAESTTHSKFQEAL